MYQGDRDHAHTSAIAGRSLLWTLVSAFEDTLRELKLTNREDPATLLVAKVIFETAQKGERDPKRLHEAAAKALSGSARKLGDYR